MIISPSSLLKKQILEVYETYSIENFIIMHGDKIPEDIMSIRESTIIIGHEHPCIGIRNGERLEKIKCFLKGITKKKIYCNAIIQLCYRRIRCPT